MKQHSIKLRILVIAVWLALWQVLSMVLPKLLFAGPAQTVQSLFFLLPSATFWRTIVTSMLKILLGFATAFVLGSGLAIAASRSRLVEALVHPAVWVMKSVPVACLILVALIWVRAPWISVLTSCFVVFPASYHAMMDGVRQMDPHLCEMSQVFCVHQGTFIRYVAMPQVMPSVLTGCKSTVGLAWKSGIAGEIIGLPDFSIGEKLYRAKLYLEIGDVFAWAIVIIVLSVLCERGILWLLNQMEQRITGQA